jgi:precorrin-6B methylase 2
MSRTVFHDPRENLFSSFALKTASGLVRRSALVFFFSIITAGVVAQHAASAPYEPVVGQDGKDVVWVPTCQELVDKMLNMARATTRDYLIDLGSGDGRTVITAAKRGIRALGIEYNPDMVALSRRNAAIEGVTERAQFVQADLFQSDFSKATVITMFLLPSINLKLRPQILDLKAGTRVVSNTFTMENWAPDETAVVDGNECGAYHTALLWIVPAKVEGAWILGKGELTIHQSFQILSGTFKAGSYETRINGEMKGDFINFTVGNARYRGRVSGSAMEGTVESGGKATKWTATQIHRAFLTPRNNGRFVSFR